MTLRAGGGGRTAREGGCFIRSGIGGADQVIPTGAAFQLVTFNAAAGGSVYYDTEAEAGLTPIADLVNSRIYVPIWARWVNVTAHISYNDQTTLGSVNGRWSIHLWRNGISTDEAHYHNHYSFPINIGSPLSGLASTGKWIRPIVPGVLEYWDIRTRQNTLQDAVLDKGTANEQEHWLSVHFKS